MIFSLHSIKQISVVILILTVFFSNISLSQRKGGGIGFFSAGYQMIDIKRLNEKLRINGFPEYENRFAAMGGGGYGVVRNLVLGGEGYGLVVSDKSNQNYYTSLTAGYGLFNVGYVAYSKQGLTVFPVLGFGGGGIDLTITKDGLVSFDDVMSNPKTGSTLSVGGLMFNIGLNAVYNMNFSQNESNSSGFVIGASLGYTHFLQLGNWTVFDREVSNGPSVGISGLYFKIMIGGGAIISGEN